MRAGDDRRERFEDVYTACYPYVLAYARRRASAELADEVAAETFLVAWRRLEHIPKRQPLPWLLAVARRMLANARRAQARRGALVERLAYRATEVNAETPPIPAGDSELLAALARLPESEREALLLVAWEELRPRDAARVVGCSSAAFRLRLHRARSRLRRELEAQARGTCPNGENEGVVTG